MKPEHLNDLEQFRRIFKESGLKNFESHLSVFETFLQTEKHVSLADLQLLLSEKGFSYSEADISETMLLLLRYGFAAESGFDKGTPLYEHRHPGQHHDHMICKECRRIIEFNNDHLEKLKDLIARTYDFKMLSHSLDIYGICSDCRTSVDRQFLVSAKPGARLVVTGLEGGKRAGMRLRSMGIKIGDEIEVVNCFGGQFVIAIDYTRLVVGHGLAAKIRVKNL